jgi:hypothetical protein
MFGKECYQKKYPDFQTPCFQQIAEGKPCSGNGCLVKVAMGNYREKDDLRRIEYLRECLHTVCRMSSDSGDNAEFLKRMAQKAGL